MIRNLELLFLFLLVKGTNVEFDTCLTTLQDQAATRGLDDDILNQLLDVIIHIDLGQYLVNKY